VKKIKLGISFGIGILFLAVFTGCAMTPKVNHIVDDSIPLERSAWISPLNAGIIIGYNGIPVSWRVWGTSAGMIQIPAGDTLLEWNVDSASGNTIYRGSNILFRFNFQPNMQYLFLAGREDGRSGFNVYIFDLGEKIPGNPYVSQNRLGFFPFLNTE